MDDIKTMQYLNIEKVNQNKIDSIENKYFRIPHRKISTLTRSSNPQYNPISAISKKLSFSELKLHDLNEQRKKISVPIFLKKIEYWTTIFAYSMSYSPLWRFPYYFMLSKGALFLIPFPPSQNFFP